MQKIGDFWIPDIDAAPGGNLERSRVGFEQRSGIQIWHLERALSFIPGRELAVDGGANVGAWTKLMGDSFSFVHSFEPNPVVFECLKRNVQEWNISHKVKAWQKAISDERKFVGIETREPGARTVTGRIRGNGHIETVLIDDLDLPACSFLKFDLEGYEAQAIRGSIETINRFRPWIMIENRPSPEEAMQGGTEPEQLLRELGYTLIEKIGDDAIDWLYKP